MKESLSISLESLSMGQLLDRSFRVYRNHFGKLVMIAAIAQIVTLVFQMGVNAYMLSVSGSVDPLAANPFLSGGGGGVILLGILGVIVTVLATLLTQAALARGVSQALLGEKFTAGSALQDAVPYVGKLFLLGFVYILFLIGALVWTIIPIVGWATGLGMIVFVAMAFTFATPILVMEDRRPGDAMLRAWFLLRRRFWPTVGYFLTVGIFTVVVNMIIVGIASFASLSLISTVPSSGELLLIQGIQLVMTAVANTIVLPLTMVAYLLYYFDLRVRTEGFDLTLQMKTESGLTPVEVMKIVPDQEKERFVTFELMMQFLLLSVAFGGIFLAFGAIISSLSLLGTSTGQVFQDVTNTLDR